MRHAVVSHIVEQETDSVYGPLQPKIDSDKYVDEYFMAAMSGMSALRGMVNLNWLVHRKKALGAKSSRQIQDTLSFLPQSNRGYLLCESGILKQID